MQDIFINIFFIFIKNRGKNYQKNRNQFSRPIKFSIPGIPCIRISHTRTENKSRCRTTGIIRSQEANLICPGEIEGCKKTLLSIKIFDQGTILYQTAGPLMSGLDLIDCTPVLNTVFFRINQKAS